MDIGQVFAYNGMYGFLVRLEEFSCHYVLLYSMYIHSQVKIFMWESLCLLQSGTYSVQFYGPGLLSFFFGILANAWAFIYNRLVGAFAAYAGDMYPKRTKGEDCEDNE